MKKFISIFLAVLMIVTMLPLSVFAENTSGIVISDKCGDNLTWTLYNDGELVIDGTGAMDNFDFRSPPWHSYMNYIKKATINYGVSSISDFAFYFCKNMVKINIPNSVIHIGDYVFCGCNLVDFYIPESVKKIGKSAFSTNFKNITVAPENNFYASKDNCLIEKSTKTLLASKDIIPDDGSVTSIGLGAFWDKSELKNVIIPSCIVNIEESAFGECKNIETIYVSEENPVYVSINNCLIEKASNSLVLGCKNSVIPNNISSICESAFDNSCADISSITIPKSVTSIKYGAFYNCDNLNTVYYTGTEEQWNNINIDQGNEDLTNADIVFNANNNTEKSNCTDLKGVVTRYSPETLLNSVGYELKDSFKISFTVFSDSLKQKIGAYSACYADINNDNQNELVVVCINKTDKSDEYILELICFYTGDDNYIYVSKLTTEKIITGINLSYHLDVYIENGYVYIQNSFASGIEGSGSHWTDYTAIYNLKNNIWNCLEDYSYGVFSGITVFEDFLNNVYLDNSDFDTYYNTSDQIQDYIEQKQNKLKNTYKITALDKTKIFDSSFLRRSSDFSWEVNGIVDQPTTFNKNTYKADLWLNLNTDKENTAEHVIVNNILSSTGNVSDNFMREIESDKGFMFNISWTEKADAFFNITDGVHKKAVGKKDLYEVLLFDMMKQKLTGAEFEQNFLADMIDASKNVENVFSATITVSGAPFELGKDFMKLKNGQINIDDYSKALFTDPAISKTFDSVDDVGLIVGNIVKFADTIEDFYTKMSAYIAAKNMSDELKTFFMEIRNNADDKHLADAAEELVRASASILDALNIATEDAAFDASFQAAGVLADIFTGALLEIPGLNIIVLIYKGLGAINDVTKMLSESICASESNRNNYYLIKATAELCNTAKKATQALADDYIENRTETNALNFIEAINMYSILKAIDCKSSITFFNSVCNEGIINKNIKMNYNVLQFLGWDIENPREEEFAQLCESADSLVESAQQQLYFLSSSWLLNDCNLKTDYPEMYNYYIKRELKYPQYTDSYKPQLHSVKLTNDFSLKLSVNSIANIHGIEIREYSDKSKDTLLNTYDVPNEKTIVYKTPDKKNNFPRTYSVAGYFEGGEGTDVDKFYTTESSSKTVGDFKPYIFYIQSDYETKSAKIMIFDNSSSDLDIVYHIYRREDDGNFNKIITIDKNTGLLGWFNIYEDHDLKEDVVYSYCVKSEISFTNGVKLYSDMSNGMAIMLTPPVDDEVRVELEVSDNVTPETNSDNQEKPENLAAAIRPLSFSNQENSENIMSLSNTAKTDASAPYGLRLSWKASKNASGYEIFRKSSYSEIYTSIGVAYKNSFTDYNISSGATYDYMVVEFSETQDEKIYLSNRVSETIDCSSLSIFSDSETADDDSAPVNLKLIFIIAASITVVVFAVGITVIVLITKRNKKNKIAGNNNNSQVPKT